MRGRGLQRNRNIAKSFVYGAFLAPIAAMAQSETEPTFILDGITVTAERTDRSLRETASSVAVFTSEDVDSRSGVFSTNDLLERIPNLISVEPSNELPAVRGIDGTGPGGGPTAFFAGSRPRLTYRVDGRTLNFNETTFGNASLWDIAQVEIFRGPQSTTQGRNAIAGLVSVKTADPTFDWQGRARVIYGNRDETQISGAVGGPIIDDVLAFRVAADRQRRDSFLALEDFPEAENSERFSVDTYRGKLLFTPSTTVRSLLTLSYQKAREPQTLIVARPFDVQVTAFPNNPVFQNESLTAISDSTIQLTDTLSLEMLASVSDFTVERFAPAFEGNAEVDGVEYIIEPLLRYRHADGAVTGFLAAYIVRSEQDETIDLFGGGAYRDETDTNAVYGEIAFRPIEALSLTLGARYEEEKRFRVGATGPLQTDFQETYKEFLPKVTVAFDVTEGVTLGATAGRGYNPGGASITLAAPFTAFAYDPEFVWSYEGFLRAGFANNVSLTANVFYNDYEGLQLPFFNNPLSIEIRNAERATTYGAEAGLLWNPSDGNDLYVNAGLLETKINEHSDPLSSGNDLPRAPAFSLNAGFNVSPGGKLEIGADVRYSDAYFSDTLNTARAKIDPYTVVNARIAYNLEPARLFIAARNLFNNTDPASIFAGPVDIFDGATLIEPRKVTAGVEVRF